MTRPAAVNTAFQLTIAGTVLGAIGSLFTFVFNDTKIQQLARQVITDSGGSVTDADFGTVVTMVRGAGVVGIALVIGLFTLLAFLARGGRNWARIALAIFACTSAITFVSTVSSTGPAPEFTWQLADIACCVAAVVYLFRKESTEYFQLGMRPGRKGNSVIPMTTNGPGSSPNEPFEPLPSAPPVYGHDMPGQQQGPRPKSVDNAFMLWMASAGLSLLVGLLSLILGGGDQIREDARKSLRDAGRSASESDVDTVVNLGIALGVVFAAVFFGLYLLFAFKMRAGRNWARITLTVLGSLSILLSLIGFAGSAAAMDVVLSVISIALIGGAIYFMFRPDAKPYFEAPRR